MPSAFEIGGLLISTTALAFVVFVFASSWIAGWFGRRYFGPLARLGSAAEWVIFAGVVGARIGFALRYPDVYRGNLVSILYFWQPGYLVWAGTASALLFLGWKIWRAPARRKTGLILTGALAPPFLLFLVVISTFNQFMPSDRLRSGMAAPPLELVDLNGRSRTLADLRGSPVILNFWATWCYACRAEMPLLNKTYEKWKPTGLTVVGVDLGETKQQIRLFLMDTPVDYDIWRDKEAQRPSPGLSAAEKYFARAGGVGLPTTIFIDRKGIIRSIQIGELKPGGLVTALATIGVATPAVAHNL